MISELLKTLKTETTTMLLLIEKKEINNESAKFANVFNSYFESVMSPLTSSIDYLNLTVGYVQ